MKNSTKLLFLFFFSVLVLNLFSQERHVKNVILMIGDGMGMNQMSAASLYKNASLNIEKCPVVGLVKTHSASDKITDSAAASTAMACGVKTKNGVIGMNEVLIPQTSIIEILENMDISTGVVVTCDVTHATPAGFLAHQQSREMKEEIALDYLDSGIDVLIGGGRNHFNDRKDKKNLMDAFYNKDYQVISSMEEIPGIKEGKLLGLIADDHPESVDERGAMLYDATTKALDLLSQNQNGFFLMIEGSQIDWFAHKNQYENMIAEILDFDETVGLVLDYAATNDSTLVIITADHETGGLTLNKGIIDVNPDFTSKEHSASLVPIYTYGPSSNKFTGIMDNTSIFDKLLKIFNKNAVNH